MKTLKTISHILFPLFIGLIIGGAIAGNKAAWISGLILLVVDILVGIALQYLLNRRLNTDSLDNLTFKEKWVIKCDTEKIKPIIDSAKMTSNLQSTVSSNGDCLKFGIYSLNEFCKHAKSTVYSWNDMGIPDDFDFPEMRESILRILELENISFETFIKRFDTISKDYHKWGKKEAVGIKFNLCQPLDFFASYMRDKRAERISLDGFYRFLTQEAIDSKVYESNLLNEGENPVSAVLNGKLNIGEKVNHNEVQRYIDILKYVLDKEEKSLEWLSNNISSVYDIDLADWFDKYDIFTKPNLDCVLNWFWIYYYYETKKI